MEALGQVAALTTGGAIAAWIYCGVVLLIRRDVPYANVGLACTWSIINCFVWLIWLCVEGF